MELEYSLQFFEKYSSTKFYANPSSGSRVVPCGQTDGQTLYTYSASLVYNKNMSFRLVYFYFNRIRILLNYGLYLSSSSPVDHNISQPGTASVFG